jgi:NAD dependent epimerase/dehydratase
MKLQGKRILVTGADGFIGSQLTEELVRQDCKVRAFVFYNSFDSLGWLDHSEEAIKKSLEIFSGDIRDPYGVRKAMQNCDIVFHLAALIGIPYSYHSPDNYVDTNIKGTLNIVQAARDLGVQKIIHTSTSEVYGTALYVPIDENHPLQAQSPYSASKIGADQLAISFHRSFGTPVAIARPFNTYGPRQSARAVIPTIISQLVKNRGAVKLGALHPTRDFNFVRDTVQGLIAIAKTDRSIGEVINLGSDYEITIRKTAELIAEIMGKNLSLVTEEHRLRPQLSEVERLWASNQKAKQLLQWAPEFAGLDGLKRGLEITVDWFLNPENLAMYKTENYVI